MTDTLIPVPRGPHIRDIDRWNAVTMREDYKGGHLIGSQDPRLWYTSPADDWTEGEEACQFAVQKGWPLDPWQEWCLKQSMGTVAGLKWSAFEVGLIVSRQNGKNQIAEIRELAGLFLINEALIIHTAHEFKASVEQFRRLRAKIEDDDWMRKQVKTITTSHGDEAIELLARPTLIMGPGRSMVRQSVAPRLRFLARSGGSGRSFTCFSGDTRYWTRDGIKTLAETTGTVQEVLVNAGSGHDGAWRKAEISSFGKAPLWAVTLRRNKQTKVIRATADHRWLVRDTRKGKPARTLVTSDLHAGHRLEWRLPKSRLKDSTPSPFGIAHGVTFGDGTRTRWGAEVQLFGEKDAQLLKYFPESRVTHVRTPGGVKGLRVPHLPLFFKDRPPLTESVPYLYGWLAGYFAADGCVTKDGLAVLGSASKENLEFVQLLATRLGIGTYTVNGGVQPDGHKAYALQFVSSSLHPEFFLIAEHRERFETAHASAHRPGRWPGGQERTERIGWTVVSAEPTADVEEVFCATVPEYENFVLEDWINVRNCNLLVWDEAMILTKEQVGAAMPTLSAVPNPQLWYMGSAGNEASVQLAQIRSRGVKGDAKRRAGLPYTDETGAPISLFYAEYSIDSCNEYCEPTCPDHPDTTECLYSCHPKCYQHDDPEDPVSWARANPGLGNRISIQHVRREMASMAPNGVVTSPADVFARERLGVGRWPADEDGWAVISEAAWDACADENSPRALAPFCVAVDVTPDQAQASIAIAGRRSDGLMVAEIAEGHHRAGTRWVIPELLRLQRELSKISPRNKPCAVVIDKSGPAGMLMNDAVNAGLKITNPSTNEAGQAFEGFYTGIQDKVIVHLGEELQPDLRAAVAGAARREIGDGGYAWARRDSAVDISPLVACTLACWGHGKFAASRYDVLKSVSPAHEWDQRGSWIVVSGD